tara:strand:+ start:335 stop:643 length:309 start_codon:yes stop_codon:yes gene_type:complete
MQINLGDTIRDERGREGVVTNIGIATDPADIAAESEQSLSAKTYDTDLNYVGAITFGSYWCYFIQIKDVIKKNDYVEDTSWMRQESDIDVSINLENESKLGK